MKREDISKIVDGIGEELIEEVSAQREREFFESRTKKRRAARRVMKIALPIAACIAVAVAVPGIIRAVRWNDSVIVTDFGRIRRRNTPYARNTRTTPALRGSMNRKEEYT